jgi:DNA-binding NarL/FixJ family response regulator
MISADPLERARDAWQRRAWEQARDSLTQADAVSPLEPADLQFLAIAAYLSGDDPGSIAAWSRAYQELLAARDVEAAARCAFWQAFQLFNAGEAARAGGWLARAQRLLAEFGDDCAAQGLVQTLTAVQLLHGGDPAGAQAGFAEALRTGQRFADRDVETLGRLGQGQSLIELGQSDEGMRLLDEVMVAVTANEVSPVVAGLAYCAMIGVCRERFDLRRAAEWTAALSEWCGAQPELVAYRGHCLIHRSELLQLRGSWADALREAVAARERLSEPTPQPALGMAYYQEAEMQRLGGELEAAENGYREAVRWGSGRQPGFALLRLVQGRLDAARAVITRLLDETGDTAGRCRLLPAYIEICIAGSDVAAARVAADELSGLADEHGAAYVRATAAHALGSVLLAEGQPRAAHAALRSACETWQDLEVPYETARTRELVAKMCDQLGDEDSAQMELAAARTIFEQLGAAPDLARLDRLHPESTAGRGGLTAREIEVLRLVASGKTNRAIAQDLVISDKTVARHVSNMLAKLDLPSRSAATAYAYEHGMI